MFVFMHISLFCFYFVLIIDRNLDFKNYQFIGVIKNVIHYINKRRKIVIILINPKINVFDSSKKKSSHLKGIFLNLVNDIYKNKCGKPHPQ